MVQNKQENCAHLPYEPQFKLVLQNGTLKNEGCADTLIKRDNVRMSENCIPQIIWWII